MRYPKWQLTTPHLDPVTVGICFLGLATLERLGLASGVSAAEVLGRVGVEFADAEEAEDVRYKYMLQAQTYVVDGMMVRVKTARRAQ